jgi:glutamyl-Q tRNA(Asp) synthetase
LKADGLVYPCFCTRADIAQSLTAPHGDAGSGYPGNCRGLPDDPARRENTAHSWRLDAGKAIARAGLPRWTEEDGNSFESRREDIGDAILARKDAPSSPTQRLLQILLGLPEPTYLHHPLVTHDNGRRLAKRDLAPTLEAMRATGIDGPLLAADLIEGRLPLGFRLSRA